jgi:hypothetical protein
MTKMWPPPNHHFHMEVCINFSPKKRFIDHDKYKGWLKFEEGDSN